MIFRSVLPALTATVLLGGILAGSGASGPAVAPMQEVEPNDGPVSAQPMAPGDTIAGTVESVEDEDWYRLDIEAPVFLVLDVDAASLDAPGVDLTLYDSEADVPFELVPGAPDQWLRTYLTPDASPYYLTVSESGGGRFGAYRLETAVVELGPADPTLPEHPFEPMLSVAAGPGALYYAGMPDYPFEGKQIWSLFRRSNGGNVETVFTAPPCVSGPPTCRLTGLTMDPSGTLFVLQPDPNGGVTRLIAIDETGAEEQQIIDDYFYDLAIDAHGGKWIGRTVLRSLDEDIEIPLPAGMGLLNDFRFAPDGSLYVAGTEGLYRAPAGAVEAGNFELVFASDSLEVRGLAFDLVGDLFVSVNRLIAEPATLDEQRVGEVWRMSANGASLQGPIAATHLYKPRELAFLVGPDGSSTSRLIVADFSTSYQSQRTWGLIEVNPAGMEGILGPPAAGAAVLAAAAEQVMGGPAALDPAAVAYLDARSNGNAVLDVGDLLALLGTP